jgi:hypothetical protein
MLLFCFSAAKEESDEEDSDEESEEEAAAPAKNGKAAAVKNDEESSEEEDDDEEEGAPKANSRPGTQDFLAEEDTSFKSRNNSFNNSNGGGSFRIFVGYLSAAPDHNALMSHLGVDESELQDMHIMGKNFDEPPRPKGYCHMEVADEATFKVII